MLKPDKADKAADFVTRGQAPLTTLRVRTNRSGALPSPQGNAPQSREAANSGAHRQDAHGIGQ